MGALICYHPSNGDSQKGAAVFRSPHNIVSAKFREKPETANRGVEVLGRSSCTLGKLGHDSSGGLHGSTGLLLRLN